MGGQHLFDARAQHHVRMGDYPCGDPRRAVPSAGGQSGLAVGELDLADWTQMFGPLAR